MKNIDNPQSVIFTPMATTSLGVFGAGGGSVWSDEDLSAVLGTDTGRFYLIHARTAGAGETGARPHGSAIDTHGGFGVTPDFVSNVDASGHMDLFRDNAQDVFYYSTGYFHVQ